MADKTPAGETPPATIGKYQVLRQIGKGATAIVYLARDPDSNTEVAVKVISLSGSNAARSRRLLRLFQTESRVGLRLEHPNIVKVHEKVLEKDRAYIVMEYIEGKALDQFVGIDRLLPMHRVVSIIFKCCLALDYAYRQGVVHRDIKPANILIDSENNPKITDFGLALDLQPREGRDSTFIMGVGSPAYMSPEQIKAYPLNQKTDLYSLGVILFQLLTGRLPFRAKKPATLIYRILNMDTPSVCAMNPNLPAGLDPVIQKAMEKDLYSRYQNGADFAKDLSAVRYQILKDDDVDEKENEARFQRLRKMNFFVDFDDIEVWETLRICTWRQFPEKSILIEEGEEGRNFGIIFEGEVEVSCEGRILYRLDAGEVLGDLSFLHPTSARRHTTAVAMTPLSYLEINGAALELSSEELQDRFNNTLLIRVLDRLNAFNRQLARSGAPAAKGEQTTSRTIGKLELLPE
ncbi:MAG: protein kinase [Betaproteobacteria bacterium]|nr:protein kinase [Betaproteobacteria bacterium]